MQGVFSACMFVSACAGHGNQIHVQTHGWWQTPLHKITKKGIVYMYANIYTKPLYLQSLLPNLCKTSPAINHSL